MPPIENDLVISSIILDSGPLGSVVYPRPNPKIYTWFQQIIALDVKVILPEIADYELRRELLHQDFTKAIERLNRLKENLIYLPLNTQAMLKAAELWAHARKRGQATVDMSALDIDVILAAQALQVQAIVVTENVKHISRYAPAKRWEEIAEMLNLETG